MRNLEFVLIGYLAKRQSACQPLDASAGIGPDLTTVEVDGRGFVFDNFTILAMADAIRAEMAGTPEPAPAPSEVGCPPEIAPEDFEAWTEFLASWPDDDDDLPPLV